MSVFECGICGEDETISSSNCIRLTDAEEDRVCKECFEGSVIDGFRQAINNPLEYPYRWGGQAIYFQNFRDHIPDDAWAELTAAYEARKEELDLRITQRLYCRLCGAFAGKRSTDGNTQCPGCSQQICAICGQRAGPHDCDDEPNENFKGLKRGAEYQRCPGCRDGIELKDGCNHMVCSKCLTNFCFICGQEALADSGHWNAGNFCPRFNQPGAGNALHDHPETPARIREAYVPDENDFRLQEHVATTRRRLRALHQELQYQLATRPDRVTIMSNEPRSHLLRRLLLTMENLILDFGLLDFEERWDVTDEDPDGVRREQIDDSWHDPRDREAMRNLPVLRDAVLDYLAMDIEAGTWRAHINEEERRRLVEQYP